MSLEGGKDNKDVLSRSFLWATGLGCTLRSRQNAFENDPLRERERGHSRGTLRTLRAPPTPTVLPLCLLQNEQCCSLVEALGGKAEDMGQASGTGPWPASGSIHHSWVKPKKSGEGRHAVKA